ncbi:hypothetical protein OIU76_003180 [Salix suchowensis]|uniref:Uncharacterized protein n=1 Tax=Salix suchowensis TaxID=1278906 RepID=A0ABQ9CGE7_9ROSI|nr:hypothetical protein OIU76_003180 [Salix suchowensis]KAJ6397301.1 hypothetical protein OIU77_018335 [Salix suchowensis]
MAAEKVTVGHEEAVEFVRKVQKHINKEIYKDFVMILCAYSDKRKDVVDLYRDVVELFADSCCDSRSRKQISDSKYINKISQLYVINVSSDT